MLCAAKCATVREVRWVASDCPAPVSAEEEGHAERRVGVGLGVPVGLLSCFVRGARGAAGPERSRHARGCPSLRPREVLDLPDEGGFDEEVKAPRLARRGRAARCVCVG